MDSSIFSSFQQSSRCSTPCSFYSISAESVTHGIQSIAAPSAVVVASDSCMRRPSLHRRSFSSTPIANINCIKSELDKPTKPNKSSPPSTIRINSHSAIKLEAGFDVTITQGSKIFGSIAKHQLTVVQKGIGVMLGPQATRFLNANPSRLLVFAVLENESHSSFQSDRIKTDENGWFEYAIPEVLSPGKYQLTLYAKDVSAGKTQAACVGSIRLTVEPQQGTDVTEVKRRVIWDFDNTLVPTNILNPASLLRDLPNVPFCRWMDLLARALNPISVMKLVSGSPEGFRPDLVAAAKQGGFEFSGGVDLKRVRDHWTHFSEQLLYKTERVLESLLRYPRGVSVDFIGDDGQQDARVYSLVTRLLNKELTPEAFAQAIADYENQEKWFGRAKSNPVFVELAQKVLARNLKAGTTLVRLITSSNESNLSKRCGIEYKKWVTGINDGLQGILVLFDRKQLEFSAVEQAFGAAMKEANVLPEIKATLADAKKREIISQETYDLILTWLEQQPLRLAEVRHA